VVAQPARSTDEIREVTICFMSSTKKVDWRMVIRGLVSGKAKSP